MPRQGCGQGTGNRAGSPPPPAPADFGGMITMDEKFPPEVPSHWLPYFAVEGVDETARIAAGAGGTLLMEPTTVPDGPRIAVLRDPQGAVFGTYLAGAEG
ncbi:VOC family protein [Streptomyces europaeiscabiei]|uniref:VOC family protein n=1 Tax=Streptomyces europaeiscabiei TaxID=146819 RepID=UPI002E19B09B